MKASVTLYFIKRFHLIQETSSLKISNDPNTLNYSDRTRGKNIYAKIHVARTKN